jgi:hypothetical protein
VAVYERVQKHNALLLIILSALIFIAHVAADRESAEVKWAEDAGGLLFARVDSISTKTHLRNNSITFTIDLISDPKLVLHGLL